MGTVTARLRAENERLKHELARLTDRLAVEQAICTARTDITERRRADAPIARQRDELAALNREKHRFFSIVAHDLKGPFFTALLGMTQVMAQAPAELSRERLADYATDVSKAGNQVFDLLRNLLDWARLQMSGADVAPRQVALRALAEECRTVLDPVAREKRIAVRNAVRRTEAFADPDMLWIVLHNLIANALKFTPGGGLPVNTNGGGLSCVHPGMYGLFCMIEAVTQVRGAGGERQIDGVDVALAHGNGGALSHQATAIFGSAATV